MAERPKYYPPAGSDFLSITDIIGNFLGNLGFGAKLPRDIPMYGGGGSISGLSGSVPERIRESKVSRPEPVIEQRQEERVEEKPKEIDSSTLALGSQLQLPKTGTSEDLVKMYAAQRSAGKYNMPEIQKMYMEQGRPDLAKWAEANPDLAQREYMKSIQKMGARPEGEELIEAYGGGEPKEGDEIIDAVNFLKKKAGLEK